MKPRPGRAAPRATKRSGTGYRTLKPDEPATSRVTHAIKLHLFPQADQPNTTPAPQVVPLKAPDQPSLNPNHLTEAA